MAIVVSSMISALNASATIPTHAKTRPQLKAGIAGIAVISEVGAGVASGVGVGGASTTKSKLLVASCPSSSRANTVIAWVPAPNSALSNVTEKGG